MQLFSCLTLSWRRSVPYRNQYIDLQSKSMGWFLYNNALRHERVNILFLFFTLSKSHWFLVQPFSFKLITHTVKFHPQISCTFYHFYFKHIQFLAQVDRICRICVRIWINNVATNCNIISKEYKGIFLYSLLLKFKDVIV